MFGTLGSISYDNVYIIVTQNCSKPDVSRMDSVFTPLNERYAPQYYVYTIVMFYTHMLCEWVWSHTHNIMNVTTICYMVLH